MRRITGHHTETVTQFPKILKWRVNVFHWGSRKGKFLPISWWTLSDLMIHQKIFHLFLHLWALFLCYKGVLLLLFLCACYSCFVLTNPDVTAAHISNTCQSPLENNDQVIVTEERADVNWTHFSEYTSLFDPDLNIRSCVNFREIGNLDQNLLLLPESLLSGCVGSDDDRRPGSNGLNVYAPFSWQNQRKVCVLWAHNLYNVVWLQIKCNPSCYFLVYR